MRLLFDQNLSRRLPYRLADVFPESRHVSELGLERASDERICATAATQGLIIVTQDEDFTEFAYLFSRPVKVIWISIGNATTAERERMLRNFQEQVEAFAADPERRLFIIS